MDQETLRIWVVVVIIGSGIAIGVTILHNQDSEGDDEKILELTTNIDIMTSEFKDDRWSIFELQFDEDGNKNNNIVFNQGMVYCKWSLWSPSKSKEKFNVVFYETNMSKSYPPNHTFSAFVFITPFGNGQKYVHPDYLNPTYRKNDFVYIVDEPIIDNYLIESGYYENTI